MRLVGSDAADGAAHAGHVDRVVRFDEVVGEVDVAALQDGLAGNFKPLAVKAAMDGLATMAFVTLFGWSVMLSVFPLMAWQGTLALLAQMAQPWLANHALLDPLNATAGLLVFCVALIVLELKKIELADYLPSLVFAPLLTWILR